MHFIVVAHAAREAIHEDGHGWNLHSTEGADFTGLGETSRGVTSQECGFISLECLGQDIGDYGIIAIINNGELLIGIGLSRCLGGIAQ